MAYYIENNLLVKVNNRFFSRVEKNSKCWLWQGSTRGGYGRFRLNKILEEAHRISYKIFYGEIPENFTIDHLCNVRACVNPNHLEAVTLQENIRRRDSSKSGEHQRQKTHCPQGHPLSGDNLLLGKQQGKYQRRRCKICVYKQNHIWREKNVL